MDEDKFKNHAEKEFWEKAYLAELPGAGNNSAIETADLAVAARRYRMSKLTPKAKAA